MPLCWAMTGTTYIRQLPRYPEIKRKDKRIKNSRERRSKCGRDTQEISGGCDGCIWSRGEFSPKTQQNDNGNAIRKVNNKQVCNIKTNMFLVDHRKTEETSV